MKLTYLENNYDLMYGPIKIGTFTEKFDPIRKVEITLNNIVTDHHHDIRWIFFGQYAVNGFIDDKHTRIWISRRVFPKARHNCDEILRELGLTEYDPIEIFKKNMGGYANDFFWVRFNDKWTFETLNINYQNFYADTNWDPVKGIKFQNVEEFGINPRYVYPWEYENVDDIEL